MSIDEFLTQISQMEGWTWEYFGGLIRCRKNREKFLHCPITGLCREKTGKDLNNCLFRKAAIELELSLEDANHIIAAVDFAGIVETTRDELRLKIEKAVGLK